MTDFAALVIAKAPVPGRVKTRLQPELSPGQAARLAGAALEDTLDVAKEAAWLGVALDLCGLARVPRWIAGEVFPQSAGSLGARLDAAFTHARTRTDLPLLLLGMDTPQVTAQDIHAVIAGLTHSDFVLGPARDGGFWTLATKGPVPSVLHAVEMSSPATGAQTKAMLESYGSVGTGPTLEDVDDADSAARVASLIPTSRFGRIHAQIQAGPL